MKATDGVPERESTAYGSRLKVGTTTLLFSKPSLQLTLGALQPSVPLPRCGNSHVASALVIVAGAELAHVTLEGPGTPHFRAFSHWFNPIDLQQLQCRPASNRDASVPARCVNGKPWSNAAWRA
jgi:hypothetical protein